MAFQRDFVFVSGLDKSYSSRKRALVRRKVHGNQTLSSDQELQLVQRDVRVQTQQQLSPASAGTSSPEEEDEHVEAERIALSSSRCVGTVVDNVMSFDPFGSTASQLQPLEQRLCQHYILAGDSMFEGAHTHAILFRETMHDEACLAGMQAYASYDLTRLGQCPPQFALAKRIESIRLINDAMKTPATAYSDTTLAAILGAIAVDVQPASAAVRAAHRLEAGVHIRGLARLVAGRGGPAQLSPWVQVFWFWMDVQTGGMLSAASHCLEEQRLRHINETSHSFDDVCLDEVSSFYTAAYKNAIRRQDSGASLSVLFAPETNFYALLARGAASRPTVRISALLYANIILLDCGSDIDAVHARFKKSTLLARLLETGNGTTEALAFALLTVDRIGGGHAIENHTRAAKLVRCLYAYNKITRHLQVQVETALMSFLPADLANMETVWDPARLRLAVSKDVNHPGVVSAEE
ncbi:hypothetical protein LTR56_011719 [Elasticomyces elasticus]|nr:hypothetical protein LTR22_023942 [Elasticomyces elasticus]KAK3640842.1 hypothetical protein LTR56_011719 [Elasticomyces elasticus]KAK5761859.1 hypothetical protein LTS12_007922 [Elasticomyces elasticus]